MVKDTKLYDILGISPNASDQDIKNAYKKQSLLYHPDKVLGASNRQTEINRARDILLDKTKRKLYDLYGPDYEQHAQQQDHQNNLFSSFFGGGGGADTKRQCAQIIVRVDVDLAKIYTGAKMQHTIERNTICTTCNGTGRSDGKCVTCKGCGGKGNVLQQIMIGPNMFQQIISECKDCGGDGVKKCLDSNMCTICLGKVYKMGKKTFDIDIMIGMPDKQTIVHRSEGHQKNGYIQGDVCFVIYQTKHAIFERDANDLKINLHINLCNALCGSRYEITTLDGRTLEFQTFGTIIKPDQEKYMLDEGMPIFKSPFSKGKLIVTFRVDFPKNKTEIQSFLNDCTENMASPPKTPTTESNLTQLHDINNTKANEDVHKKEKDDADDDDYDYDDQMKSDNLNRCNNQ